MDPPNKTVHQHITNESLLIWKSVPYEIKSHGTRPIISQVNGDFNLGVDDIITGSGEEDRRLDTILSAFTNHFWQPDDPDTLTSGRGDYDDGLFLGGSSFVKAKEIWLMNIIPNYLSGNINESYYHLGRVAHLIEDATQPSHVHLDSHFGHQGILCGGTNADCDDSFLEEYTADNLQTLQNTYNWSGENFENNYYKYENLISGFDWGNVDATYPDSYGSVIPLFRLMWYNAQKTQYFASDDNDGNSIYVDLDGTQQNFPSSLWQGDGVTIVSDNAAFDGEDYYYSQSNQGSTCTEASQEECISQSMSFPCYLCNNNTGLDIYKEINAVIPHSMKSVAGLYRLFWDAVHIDWPFFHGNLRRTGYTLLKGDMTNSTTQSILSFAGTPATDFWDDPAIANVRNDLAGSEIIVSTQNYDYTDGRVYMLNGSGSQKWSFTDGQPIFAPSIDDIDGDGNKEVVVASGESSTDNWRIYALNGESGTQHWSSPISLPNKTNQRGARHTAIDDLNHDGDKEIIYSEVGSSNSFTAYVYAVNHDKSGFWNSSSQGQGYQTPMAIANLNGDGYEDVIAPNFCEVIAFDGEDGSRLWNRSIGLNYAGPAVADLNNDGNYEVVVATTYHSSIVDCGGNLYITAYNQTYVLDNQGNILWNKSIDFDAIGTPAIANLDSDSNLEIVVATAEDPDFSNQPNKNPNRGSIYIFDGVTGDLQCKYTNTGKVQVSPAIADIDNDGTKEIIFGSYDNKTYVINPSCQKEWDYNFNSYIFSSPAIGDIDNDKVAEIVVKHAHSYMNEAYGGGPMKAMTEEEYQKKLKEKEEKKKEISNHQEKINRKTFDILTELDDEAEEEFIIQFKDNIKDLPNIKKSKEIKSKKIMLTKGKVNEIKSLLERDDIDSIEYNEKIKLTSDSIPYNINKTNAPSVWGKTDGKGVKIALIDSGISPHDDLKIAGGISFVSQDYNDNIGHGTAIAGIVSSLLNDKGIVGVAPKADIYAVKIFENNEGNLYDAIEAIEWAIDNKMDIISMSWGLSTYSRILEEALYKAYENGILLIASSGNDGENKILYPAHYPQVIAVGALDKNNNKASFSNYGDKLELVAPGVDIYTTNKNNNYFTNTSGTSFATPHIAGIGALIKSYKKDLTNCQIREILRKSATDLGKTGFDEEYGYGFGIINLDVINNIDLSTINCSLQREIKNITEEPEEIFLLATEASTLETLGGTNRKPQIVNLSEYNIYVTGNLITLKVEAIDLDNNSLTYYYSSPFNSLGQWQTNENSSGTYAIFVQVSDGNLTDEGYINFKVVSNKSYVINTFSDGSSEINLTFNSSGNQTIYVTIPSYVNITGAILNITGFFVNGTYPTSSFQEPYPQVLCYVSGDDPNKAIDKDWATYYDVGSLTEICVEGNNLTVPTNYTHLELHLRLRVWDYDCCDEPGVLDIYNYSNQVFYRLFSNVSPCSDCEYYDYYFDIYRDDASPLWQNDITHKVYKTSLQDFVGTNTGGQVQWHYDSYGRWASQKVYESEVRFYKQNPFPHYPQLDIGNDTSYEWNYTDELISYDLSSDFSDVLNDYISSSNSSGNITIPLTFHSESAGILNIKGLKIYYKTDVDNDGYYHLTDCDDLNANVNPGVDEICTDNIDNNCNGQIDELVCTNILDVSELSHIYPYINSTFEFKIKNNLNFNISGINWSFNSGESIINSTILVNLTPNDELFVYFSHNYSSFGEYLVSVRAFNGNYNSTKNLSISIKEIDVNNLILLYANATKRIFQFNVRDIDLNPINISWSFNSGENVVNSNQNINLNQSEEAFIFLEYDYSSFGIFVINASANTSRSADLEISSINVKVINISGLSILDESATKVIFEFFVSNNWHINLTNVSWTFDINNGDEINSEKIVTLQPKEGMFIFVNYDFLTSGTYDVNATARNGTLTDSMNLSVTAVNIELKNITVLNENATKRIFELVIENALLTDLTSVNWTFDTKDNFVINATSNSLLQPLKQMFVYIDYNFTTSGTFNVNATAKNGTLSDSRNLTVVIT